MVIGHHVMVPFTAPPPHSLLSEEPLGKLLAMSSTAGGHPNTYSSDRVDAGVTASQVVSAGVDSFLLRVESHKLKAFLRLVGRSKQRHRRRCRLSWAVMILC